MTDRPFVHLHTHSEYSMLDGISHLADLASAAAAFSMPALALTDHGNLHGAVDFYQECKKAASARSASAGNRYEFGPNCPNPHPTDKPH